MTHLHPPRSILAGLALSAVVVTACGMSTEMSASPVTPAPSAAAASTAPAASSGPAASQATTGHIVVADHGFGLTLPDGWESQPVEPTALQAVIDDLPEGSEMRGVLESQMGSAALQSIAFWAFDLRPESGVPGLTRNVNIIVQPASTFPLSQVEAAIKAQLGAVEGIGTIDSSVVTLPSGEALRLEYGIDVPDASGTATSIVTTQYYVQLPTSTLIVSFTSEPDAADAAADIEAIITSLEAAS